MKTLENNYPLLRKVVKLKKELDKEHVPSYIVPLVRLGNLPSPYPSGSSILNASY